jgi:hypothetical protein
VPRELARASFRSSSSTSGSSRLAECGSPRSRELRGGHVVHQRQMVPAQGRSCQQTLEISQSGQAYTASIETTRRPNVDRAFSFNPRTYAARSLVGARVSHAS